MEVTCESGGGEKFTLGIYIYIYADVSDIKRRDMNNTHMVRLEREKLEREGKWEQGWGERGIRTVVVVPELDAW